MKLPSLRSSLIFGVALILAAFAMATSLARITQFKQPQLALAMPVENGFAKSEWAERLIAQSVPEGSTTAVDLSLSPAGIQEVRRLSLESFSAEPLDFKALRNLALLQEANGNRSKARGLMRNVASITKRDTTANLWLVRDYSELAEFDAAMATYDQALRTSETAQALLLPEMYKAMASEVLIEPLVDLLGKNPNWGQPFWDGVFAVPEAIENAATVRIALANKEDVSTARSDQYLIEALTRRGHFGKGIELSEALRPSSSQAGIVRNSDFSDVPGFVPYDWELFFDSFFSVDVDQAAGKMRINTFADGSGLVARQLLSLPQDIYRFSVKGSEWDQLDNNALYARIYCAEVGAGSQNQTRITISNADFGVTFQKARRDCNYHWLDIYAARQAGQQDNTVVLDKVTLEPTTRG